MHFLLQAFRFPPTFTSIALAFLGMYALFLVLRLIIFLTREFGYEGKLLPKLITYKKYLVFEIAVYVVLGIYACCYLPQFVNWFASLIN